MMAQTNVAFIAGEGQFDYYSITVETAGYVHFRMSFTTPSTGQFSVSNVQLLDGSQNMLPNFSQVSGNFRNVASGSTALSTVEFSGQPSISFTQTNNEYFNMAYIEIDTNLAAGTYYIVVAAQDLMSYYGPVDAPYLIYSLPLAGETPAAVLE